MLKLENYNKLAVREKYYRFFGLSILFSLLGIVAAHLLFPSESGLVSTFLISFSLLYIYEYVLKTNRNQIWVEKKSPMYANVETLLYLLFVFLGVFSVYLAVSLNLNVETAREVFDKQLINAPASVYSLDLSSFRLLFLNNLIVLFIFFFFSLFYRTGGIFVIVWNASVWGSIFGVIGNQTSIVSDANIFIVIAKLAIAVVPHLLFEATSYLLASLSGLFLSKAFIKYPVGNEAFLKVASSAIILLLLSMLVLVLASVLESQYAHRLIQFLFH